MRFCRAQRWVRCWRAAKTPHPFEIVGRPLCPLPQGGEPYCVQKNFHHTINQLSEARSTAQMADCIQVTVAGAHQAALSCRSCHMSAPAVLCKLHLSSQIAAPSNSQNEALRKEARTV